MELDRRDALKVAGVAASGFTLAGCLGTGSGSDDATNDTGDETVTPGDPGWSDIDSNVFEERMGPRARSHRILAVSDRGRLRSAICRG